MRTKNLGAAVLAALAVAAVTIPASAEPSGYTIAPAGPADPRNNYVPQAGAVFVVDDAKGAIIMCFPDNKDNKVVVVCTPATKLPQYAGGLSAGGFGCPVGDEVCRRSRRWSSDDTVRYRRGQADVEVVGKADARLR